MVVAVAVLSSCVVGQDLVLAVQDPVDGEYAVLVKRYNITQQKELELRLSDRQDDLLRSVKAPHAMQQQCPESDCQDDLLSSLSLLL